MGVNWLGKDQCQLNHCRSSRQILGKLFYILKENLAKKLRGKYDFFVGGNGVF